MMRVKGPQFLELSKEILNGGRRIKFVATGTSMSPFIKPGTTLEIEPVDETGVAAGEVILFCSASGRPVVHRVVRVKGQGEESWAITRGDNALRADDTITMRQVLGRVVAMRRDGREVRLDTTVWRMFGKMQIFVAPSRVTVLRLGHRMMKLFTKRNEAIS